MLSRIRDWHKLDEHEKILGEINKIPREFWDYEVTCLYARALNNSNQYEEALSLLTSVRTLGQNDMVWNFRIGYSLYFLGKEAEAINYLQKAISLGDDSEDARELLNACVDELQQQKGKSGENSPDLYFEADLDALERHIERRFGAFKNVFHEIDSPDIHLDIAVIEPSDERNYYTLVTMGMGARKMKVPQELSEYRLERAELMICLPPDWRLDDLADEKWYWPLRWLKILARLPGQNNTWLGWGHTIPNGGPLAENTRLSGIMLIYPGAFGEKSFECALPSGSEVNFYQLIPLYDEELEYKLTHNAEGLLDIMDDEHLNYIKIDRKAASADL